MAPYIKAEMLIEGYGEIKTSTITTNRVSGYKTVRETNALGAFVAFFHPASKYSGSGTDCFFARDFVITTYPPSAA